MEIVSSQELISAASQRVIGQAFYVHQTFAELPIWLRISLYTAVPHPDGRQAICWINYITRPDRRQFKVPAKIELRVTETALKSRDDQVRDFIHWDNFLRPDLGDLPSFQVIHKDAEKGRCVPSLRIEPIAQAHFGFLIGSLSMATVQKQLTEDNKPAIDANLICETFLTRAVGLLLDQQQDWNESMSWLSSSLIG